MDEFSAIYIFNLRGDQRTSGEISRREGGKMFGAGSRAPIAITLLVKNPAASGPCVLRYHDIGDYLAREEKLAIIRDFGSIEGIPWERIIPDDAGSWINQGDKTFAGFAPLGDKRDPSAGPLFGVYSQGLLTARDAWAYNFSREAVVANMRRMVDFYNAQVTGFGRWVRENNRTPTSADVEKFIDLDPTRISWTRALKADVRKSKVATFDQRRVVVSMYRPYCKQWLYFDRQLNEMVLLMPKLFPTPEHENVVITMNAADPRQTFGAIAMDVVPDLHVHDTGQCFPLYYYEPPDSDGTLFTDGQVIGGYRRRDALTDATLVRYQKHYGPEVTKEDIFYYVYGLVHSPAYRQRFAVDLKKMIPRVPLVTDFRGFSDAGRQLAAWHVDYEEVDPWPLDEDVIGTRGSFRVEKMRFAKDGRALDRSRIVLNEHLTLAGVPQEAYRYEVSGKSAIEWIMDRYQVRTDRSSQIRNDPNDWAVEENNPRYIVDLVKRIVSVSMASTEIIDGLPDLVLLDEAISAAPTS
jgi:predicted helicase